jgi:5-amino-6-(5-phospho-D-ribitylamino)uracil phosphatase
MLLAFDLDRTVVTDAFILPDTIAAAIRAARRAGHHVTVLTGRTRVAAQDYLDQLEVDGPCSVNHGALVLGAGGATLRRVRLAPADVCGVIAPYLDGDGVEFSCAVDDTLYVKEPGDERWLWAHSRNRRVERFSIDFALQADKVVFAASAATSAVHDDLGRLMPHLTRYLWGDGFLEVIGPGADKGSALAYIAGTLGVPREEVVAFGDGLNDVTMVSWAGRGVAVGPHAHEDVLAVADERIASPEEGGVVSWLEEHAL